MSVIPEGIPAVQEQDAEEVVRGLMRDKQNLVAKSVIIWLVLEAVHIALSVWIAERWKT